MSLGVLFRWRDIWHKVCFFKNVLGKIISPKNSQKLPRWNQWNQWDSFCDFWAKWFSQPCSLKKQTLVKFNYTVFPQIRSHKTSYSKLWFKGNFQVPGPWNIFCRQLGRFGGGGFYICVPLYMDGHKCENPSGIFKCT